MFTITIKNEVLPEHAYYAELMINCTLAKNAFKRLNEYASAQLSNKGSSKESLPKTPIEVIAECYVFLSAVGIVSKMIFPSEKSKPPLKERAVLLRKKIDIGDMPILKSRMVRDSFEHVDERLDSLMKEIGGHGLCQLDITGKDSRSKFVLKRFNPRKMEISFLGLTIDLQECMIELIEFERKLYRVMDASN